MRSLGLEWIPCPGRRNICSLHIYTLVYKDLLKQLRVKNSFKELSLGVVHFRSAECKHWNWNPDKSQNYNLLNWMSTYLLTPYLHPRAIHWLRCVYLQTPFSSSAIARPFLPILRTLFTPETPQRHFHVHLTFFTVRQTDQTRYRELENSHNTFTQPSVSWLSRFCV